MKTNTKNTTSVLSRWMRFLGAMLTVALMVPAAAVSQSPAPVNLRSTEGFAILAGSLISNVPTSAVTGDIGLSPAAGSNITGFGPTEVTGTIYTVDATGPAGSVPAATMLTAAQGDLTTAYNDAVGRTPVPTGTFLNPGSGNIGGLSLVAGLYKFTGSALITGSDVTLTGSATDVWIFQIAADLNVGSGIQVILAGGAKAANIFWQVGTSATLGTTSVFKGTIMADQSISLSTGARLDGRALARIAAVTLASNAVTKPATVTSQAPVLESPADLATNQSTTVELKWFAAAGDSVYHLQIDTSIVFGTTVYDDSTLTGILHKITGLRNATKYYWRVSVRDSVKDGGTLSPYSTVRSFTTWNYTPTTPLLPVTLGLTGGFAILSYAGITNTGPTSITGDVGVSPLAASYMSGFGTPNVVGTIYGVDATGPAGSIPFPSMLTVAMVDLTIAFNDAAGRTVNPIGVSGNLGGRTLYSGLYKSTSSLEISSGDLTLDAQGDVNAVWIFQIASSFNMTSGRQVFLSGGAKASNIFWQVGSAATFGTTAVMKGTIMAYANITFATGASLEGRALARTESVTLQSNVIGATTDSPLRAVVFLGSAANFKVLAGSKINSTGLTAITGDIGVSPSTVINGFPPGTLTGVQHPGNATSAAAQLDLKAAYDSAAARMVDSTITTQLGGLTYTPGVYSSGSGTFGITDTLTLNGGGDASAVWIFKMTGALTTASGSYVKLLNGAQWYNVFWHVGTSATLGSNSSFRGNIMALSAITANEGATISGRLLARTDSVSLSNNNIGGVSVVTTVRTEYVPEGFTLSQNYPNPFNPSTKIQYTIGSAGLVSLKVYNVLGLEVATLVNSRQEAGTYIVPFETNKGTHSLSSGMYFYRLQAGSFVSTKKLILVK